MLKQIIHSETSAAAGEVEAENSVGRRLHMKNHVEEHDEEVFLLIVAYVSL